MVVVVQIRRHTKFRLYERETKERRSIFPETKTFEYTNITQMDIFSTIVGIKFEGLEKVQPFQGKQYISCIGYIGVQGP